MKLLNSVTNVSVAGDNLQVAKADGSTSTVNVPYAVSSSKQKAIYLGNFQGKTKDDFVSALLSAIQTYNIEKGSGILFWAFPNADNIAYGINNDMPFANNTSPSGIKIVGGHAFQNGYYKVLLVNCGAPIYESDIANGSLNRFEKIIKTKNDKNVADTWKLSTGNELVIDANNTSTNQVVIGNKADNYTGSGFKYIFKNGKGNNADVYVDNVYGNVKGAISIPEMSSIDNPNLNGFYTTTIEYTGNNSIDNGMKYYTVISSRYTGAKNQIGIPTFSNSNRVIVRGQNNANDGLITIPFREIPYLDEVVTLTGTSTVTGTLNVPTQASTDNSDKVASTAFVQAAIAAALKAKGL